MSVRGCYQGVISFKTAEIRLRQNGKDLSYLTRESDTKKGKFILSWLSNKGIAKHTTVQNPSARLSYKNFEELQGCDQCDFKTPYL